MGILMLLHTTVVQAQKPQWAQLHGRVVDVDLGEPIVGVPVRIEGTQLETLTDEQGNFSFDLTPPGDLVVVAEGVVIEATRTSVAAGGRTEPVIVHARYSSLPESTVTVVASRPRPMTASSSHVTAREMSAVPRRTAEDALRLVPGLMLVQHGSEGKGHQFFLRGFDAIHGADLELTLEGIPVNEWSNIHAQGYIDLGFIIPETIESVEVTKGPFTLEQGAFAMAGSADYQLGIAEADRGIRSIYTMGTTNRHRGVVTYSPREGDGKQFVAAEALHDDGFGENRAIDRGAALFRVRLFDSSEHGTLFLLGSGYLAGFELPGTLRDEDVQSGRVDFYDVYDRAGRGFSGRGLVALFHKWRRGNQELQSTVYGDYRHLELLENYTGFLIDPVNGDRRGQLQKAWNFGATIVHDLRLTDEFNLQTGLGIRGDVLDQKQEHVDQQELPLATERALEGLQTLTHARLGLQWQPVESMHLEAGARVDVAHVSVRDGLAEGKQSSGTLAAVSPRATAEWRVLAPWRLFAAYGRGFRPPEARAFTSFSPEQIGISEDVYNGGNPAMTTADSFELGTRLTPSRFLGARVSVFETLIERESVFDHVSGINLELNSTRRLGGELELNSNPLDWLMIRADVTYVDARFVDSGNPIPLAPWLVGSFRTIVTHPSGLRAGMRLSGWAPRALPHGARGAATTMLDATVGHTWRWLRFDVELENILQQQIREGEYHYASHWRPGEEPSEIPVLHYVAGPPFNARFSATAVF